MFTIFAFVIGIGCIAGLVVLAYATVTAPFGYQDESGFHFGQPTRTYVDEGMSLSAEWADSFARQVTRRVDICADRLGSEMAMPAPYLH